LNTESVVERIENWIENLVVGLNLCPFANSVRRKALIRISVIDDATLEGCLQQLATEAYRLEEGNQQSTTLLVIPRGFEDFEEYMDLLALAESLLEDLGFEGILQLASFHPKYQFEGTATEDVSNWTNRAPFPILHLLTEASVSRAVQQHPDPDGIPDKNIKALNSLGSAGVMELLNNR